MEWLSAMPWAREVPCSSLIRDIVLCPWEKHFILTHSLQAASCTHPGSNQINILKWLKKCWLRCKASTNTNKEGHVTYLDVQGLTLYQLMWSTDNLCKQFGPRLGPTKCWAWSGSKLLDTQKWDGIPERIFQKKLISKKISWEKFPSRQRIKLASRFLNW